MEENKEQKNCLSKYSAKATAELAQMECNIWNFGYFPELAIRCLNEGADPNNVPMLHIGRIYTSFELAMNQGEIKVMEVMFEKGAIITPNTYRTFLEGCYDNGLIGFKESFVIGRMLLEHGLDPDSYCDRYSKGATFRKFFERDCAKALAIAKQKPECSYLIQEVTDFKEALKKSDALYSLDTKKLESNIALLQTVLKSKRLGSTQLSQLNTQIDRY